MPASLPPLPDCPSCDAEQSLERVCVQGSAIECVCTCCARTCLVKDGRVVHPVPSLVDVRGVQMHDP